MGDIWDGTRSSMANQIIKITQILHSKFDKNKMKFISVAERLIAKIFKKGRHMLKIIHDNLRY